jgi:hypothetical protein
MGCWRDILADKWIRHSKFIPEFILKTSSVCMWKRVLHPYNNRTEMVLMRFIAWNESITNILNINRIANAIKEYLGKRWNLVLLMPGLVVKRWRWKDDIKMDLSDTYCKTWNGFNWDTIRSNPVCGAKVSSSITRGTAVALPLKECLPYFEIEHLVPYRVKVKCTFRPTQ